MINSCKISGANVLSVRRMWMTWICSGILGGLVAYASIAWGLPARWPMAVWRLLCRAYELVGVALVGLLPLALWLCRLFWQHMTQPREHNDFIELGYSVVQRQAPLWGLCGTIVALGAAGSRLATQVSNGSSAAVLQIIPLVGQALISTIVGIVIALVADTALYPIELKRLKEEADVTSIPSNEVSQTQ